MIIDIKKIKEQSNFINDDIIKSIPYNNINNLNPLKYEDTIFKDLADDISKSQESTNDLITEYIVYQQKQNIEQSKIDNKRYKSTLVINIITLLVAIFTLIVSIAAILK